MPGQDDLVTLERLVDDPQRWYLRAQALAADGGQQRLRTIWGPLLLPVGRVDQFARDAAHARRDARSAHEDRVFDVQTLTVARYLAGPPCMVEWVDMDGQPAAIRAYVGPQGERWPPQ